MHNNNTLEWELPKTTSIHSPCKKQNFRLMTNYFCSTLLLYLLLTQGHVARFPSHLVNFPNMIYIKITIFHFLWCLIQLISHFFIQYTTCLFCWLRDMKSLQRVHNFRLRSYCRISLLPTTWQLQTLGSSGLLSRS